MDVEAYILEKIILLKMKNVTAVKNLDIGVHTEEQKYEGQI